MNMMMDEIIEKKLKEQMTLEQEEEEALSLSDLPLDPDADHAVGTGTSGTTTCDDDTPKQQPPPEFFEFFSDLTSSQSHMCSAEDIIFCGKLLVPEKKLDPSYLSKLSNRSDLTTTSNNQRPSPRPRARDDVSLRRRSGSLSELQSTNRSYSTKAKLMRNSWSLDYRKHHRSWSSEPESDRNTSAKSDNKNNSINCGGGATANKVGYLKSSSGSRWYTVMFGIGMVKLPPPEMELRDIKNRQVRRNNNPGTMVGQAVNDNEGFNGRRTRSGGKGVQWGILIKALSCKDHGNVSVAATSS